MRETFRGYYYPRDEDFVDLWETGLFVFDANILLNIYRYSFDTRNKFINILKEISSRIVIPHQAAKEYQDNRLNVIKEQQAAYDTIKEDLGKKFKDIERNLNSYKRHPLIDVSEIIEGLNNSFTKIISDLDEKENEHPDLFSNDDLRDELTDLLENKITKPFSDEVMDQIFVEGKTRYANKIPPGFKDVNKEGLKKCGDLILWYQILDLAKSKQLPIIFITDDQKEDWWWKFDGKTIGPRQELIEEIYNEAKVKFYMYKTDKFIELAEKQFFRQDADPRFIEEVKDVMSREKLGFTYEYEILDNLNSNIPLQYPEIQYSELEETEKRLNEIIHGHKFSSSELSSMRFRLENIKDNYENDRRQLHVELLKLSKELEYFTKESIETHSNKKREHYVSRREDIRNQIDMIEDQIDEIEWNLSHTTNLLRRVKNLQKFKD